MDLSPKLGITIDQYFEVFVRSGGALGPDLGLAVAKAAGLDATRWAAAAPKWKSVIDAHMAHADVVAAYEATMTRVRGAPPDIGILAYADLCVRAQRGEDLTAAAIEYGIDILDFGRISTAYVAELGHPRMSVAYGAAHQKASAYGGRACAANHAAPTSAARRTQRRGSAEPPLRVRGWRCPKCGAFKATAHDRAYIYCDYCSALFDFDLKMLSTKERSLKQDAFVSCAMALDGEDRPTESGARAEADREGRIWMERLLVELFPLEHPGRVVDREYRDAYVERWLVPSTTAWMHDPACRKSAETLGKRQHYLTGKKPTLAGVKLLYTAMIEHLANQRAVLEREGILAAHPDGIDGELFVRFSRSAFVGGWVNELSPEEGDALIALAGLDVEMVPAPSTALVNAGCASCGSDLVIAQGATRAVCTACGVVVEASEPRDCRACGAVLVSAHGKWSACGYCHTRWDAV